MSYFVDENLEGEPREEVSPSGRYRLLVRTYRTKPNAWNYSRGTVIRIADGATVCDIERNLSGFHHSFIEKDGHEWLVAGRHYLSQTIIDLDTGAVHEGPEWKTGGEFCWAQCTLSPDGATLAVDGCIWACPYEFRFFDFRDPSRGWPELPLVGAERIEDPSDASRSRWIGERVFQCNLADHDKAAQERIVVERRGDEMHVIEHWVSEAEQARRDAEARKDAELDAWWDEFSTSDPMYLRFAALVREYKLAPGLLPGRPGARRVREWFRRKSPRAAADFDWKVEAETLEVQTYDGAGNEGRKLSFPCSLDGIEAAMAAIRDVFA